MLAEHAEDDRRDVIGDDLGDDRVPERAEPRGAGASRLSSFYSARRLPFVLRFAGTGGPSVNLIGKPMRVSTQSGFRPIPQNPFVHTLSVSVSPMFAFFASGLRFAVRLRAPAPS